MQEKLKSLWAKAVEKVVENKEIVIKAGIAVAGAVLGAVVAGVIAKAREEDLAEYPFFEEDETQNDEPIE